MLFNPTCPFPKNDGASDHLPSLQLPSLLLSATNGVLFEVGGMTLIRQLALIILKSRIDTVFNPIFSPDADAGKAVAKLRLQDS